MKQTFPSNSNTSATGGYLYPQKPTPAPGGLSFEQFVQTVLVGVSGLPGDLVREAWQLQGPKQPDALVDWMKFAVTENLADTNAYFQGTQFMRMEELTLQCSFYGPNALEYGRLTRDNLQIKQNLQALQSALMNFVSTGALTRVPDLINERWVNRWEMSIRMRREILRTYPVLNFVSLVGSVVVNTASGTKTVNIQEAL